MINAFSAMVSNAELIRSHASDPKCNLAELAALGTAIIENALTASHVPRRLIDLTRRVTSPGFDQVGDPPGLIDLNQLIRDTVEARSSAGPDGLEFSTNLGPIAMIRGNEPQLRSLLGYLIRNAREAMIGGAGKISFTTRMDPRNWVILEVRDDGDRDDSGSPQACDRAVLHDQAGTERDRLERGAWDLAAPSGCPFDREPTRRRDDDPPGRRSTAGHR